MDSTPGARDKKAGFREIAAEAGVSVSTVDRVLNERGPVSEKSRRKVLAAATALDVGRRLPGAWQPHRRIEVLLPQNDTPFWRQLDAAFRSLARHLGPHVTLQRTFVPQKSPEAWRQAILFPPTRRDALVIAADGRVEEALARARRRGETVVSLTTRLQDGLSAYHSGADNLAAGRLAANLLGPRLAAGGEVVVLKATDRRLEHADRVEGFVSAIGGRAVRVVTTDEQPLRSREALRELRLTADIAGIYTTEYSPAAIREVLREMAVPVPWVGHDLSEDITDCLEQRLLDFTIDQDPVGQATWALKLATAGWEPVAMLFALARPPAARIFCRGQMA